MITANKGEWSELYVLYRLFAEHKISAADNNLQPTSKQYQFLKIFREDTSKKTIVYDLANENKVIIHGNGEDKEISVVGLSEKTKRIFKAIKDATDTTFTIVEAENLMTDFALTKIKANSNEKSDLIATIKDDLISETTPYGFSIKSQVGGASTLLNASGHGTNFIYKISNFIGDINTINSIKTRSKVRDRLQALINVGARLDYFGMVNQTFKENMRMVDSVLPNIIAQMLMNYYFGNGHNLNKLCKLLAQDNEFDLNELQIVSKIKNFLKIVALGMVPKTPWNDRLSTYGGYIVVREDGQLVCYHLYNEDAFKDYLFNNTKFDTPSSTRHNFGSIYEKGGDLFINLNLQIRFLQ